MSALRVVTVAGNINHETVLAESLGFRPDVELVLRCLDRVELLAALRGGHLDAIVLVGSVDWFDRQIASEAAQRHVTIVALSEEPPPNGVAPLTVDASIDEIVEACKDSPTALVSSPSTTPSHRGRVTAVWGPKGSPGRTRTAIELAFALQGTGATTLLLDSDPYGGDILQTLGIVEELPTVIWAARLASKGELDSSQIEVNLRRIAKGPVILPGLPRADLWADVSEFGFDQLLDACRGSFQHTIADAGFCLELGASGFVEGGDGRNRMARGLVRDADRIVAVCNASPIGIKNFLWAFEELAALVDLDKVVVAVNRVQEGSERELSRLLDKHIGKRPVAYIPDRAELMEAASGAGTAASSLKSGSEVRSSVEALAISVGAKLRPRGVLTRLGARR